MINIFTRSAGNLLLNLPPYKITGTWIFMFLLSAWFLYGVVIKGILQIRKWKRFMTGSTATFGKVIDMHVKEDSDKNRQYAPIVEYSPEGQAVTLYDNGFRYRKPVVGNEVTIHYVPGSPKEGIVNIPGKITSKWLEIAVCSGAILFGLVMLYIFGEQ